MDTPAGSGRNQSTPSTKVIRVTNLNADGPGSLKAAIDTPGPRTVIFEISGVIVLNGPLAIREPYLTIAGQTAPSPGIMIRGGGIHIRNTHDILISHIRIRPGDEMGPNDWVNALSIMNTGGARPDRIVIDHVTLNWSVDQLSEVWNDVGDITYWRTIMSEALQESVHSKDASHSAGPILGTAGGRVSGIGSLLSNNAIRQPRTAIAETAWVNNVHYNRYQSFAEINNLDSGPTKSSFVGNVYIEGPSLRGWASGNKPIWIASDFLSGSRVYLADNVSSKWSKSSEWDLVWNQSANGQAVIQANTPPTWPDGLVAASTASNGVLNAVLDHVGARPLDRDVVEKRLVDQVRRNTGNYVNCVGPVGPGRDCVSHNAGGWPSYAVNTRPLTIPGQPNDIMPSGYTRLEEWLNDDSIWNVGR